MNKKKLIFFGGAPGGGKSFFRDLFLGRVGNHINADKYLEDEIKPMAINPLTGGLDSEDGNIGVSDILRGESVPIPQQFAQPLSVLMAQQNMLGHTLANQNNMLVSAMPMTTVGTWGQVGFLGRNRTVNFTLDDPILTGQIAESTFDSELRLHSHNNMPAVIIKDANTGVIANLIYAWHGVRVPDFVITNPEKITIEVIEVAGNSEIRRVMIEKYGVERYMQDCGAKLLHKDITGELYQKQLSGVEPMTFVKVKNSTPEPDGTYKDYFLRVPPTMTTATEAVAWTFRMSPDEYKLALET